MADNLDKEYQDIKAGVEGLLSEAPSPTEISETQEETAPLPETTFSESTNYGETPTYESQEYGNQGGMGITPERIHSVIEAVVNEKLEETLGKIGDLSAWKEKINNDVISIKQEVLRISERFENLQTAILGRVKTYDEGIRNIGSEMKALEKVFERIMDPLMTNVKELSRITEEMKKHKK